MSYHIYTTKGIVLSLRPMREADRIYTIMTRDLGLVRAVAIGVRKEASKLRGSIEPFSLSSISLVKGKDYWRLTSAQFLQNISALPSIARPLSLIEKLVQGEEPHPELFDTIEQFTLVYPERGRGAPKLDDEMSEIRLASQILHHLGYLKKADLNLDKKALIEAINNGIQASHLT